MLLRRYSALFSALVSVIIGCGTAATPLPELQPVSGSVSLDGQPLARAVLSFLPQGRTTGQVSVGVTDEQGKFECEYPGGAKGVPVGEYKVLISKLVTPSGEPLPEGSTAADLEAKEIVPAKYRRLDDRVNTVAIPQGGKSDLAFELKSK